MNERINKLFVVKIEIFQLNLWRFGRLLLWLKLSTVCIRLLRIGGRARFERIAYFDFQAWMLIEHLFELGFVIGGQVEQLLQHDLVQLEHFALVAQISTQHVNVEGQRVHLFALLITHQRDHRFDQIQQGFDQHDATLALSQQLAMRRERCHLEQIGEMFAEQDDAQLFACLRILHDLVERFDHAEQLVGVVRAAH